jgi:hypothetical protein
MYNGSLKSFIDLVYPISAFLYFIIFKDLKLINYDSYEMQQNLQSQESGNDLLIDLLGDKKGEYIAFVYCTIILCALIFNKFKTWLSMNSKMNSVIQLVDYCLIEAKHFLIYYFILMLFFCVLFMV